MATTEQTTIRKVMSYKLDPFMSGLIAALVGIAVFLLLQADGREIVAALGCGVFCFAVGYLSRRYSRHPSER